MSNHVDLNATNIKGSKIQWYKSVRNIFLGLERTKMKGNKGHVPNEVGTVREVSSISVFIITFLFGQRKMLLLLT